MKLVNDIRALKDRVLHHLGPRHAEVLEGIAVAAEHAGPEPEQEEVKENPTEQSQSVETEPSPKEEKLESFYPLPSTPSPVFSPGAGAEKKAL